LTLLKNRNCK